MRVVIAQCTSKKRSEECKARNLYDESRYFRHQREYAELKGDVWYIQSAKHGLVHPDSIKEPYDKRPKNIDDVGAWAEDIAAQLVLRHGTDVTVELLGGKSYTDPLTPELERFGIEVHEPLRGMGIGDRNKKLNQETAKMTHGGFHG